MNATYPIDAELLLAGRDDISDPALRVWLRISSCVALIDEELRRRLREGFGTTRPRFDFLAHLASAPDGLTLGELSQRMMVSNGNMTGLAKRLLQEGLIERRPEVTDRRITRVVLTEDGAEAQAAMAQTYEDCVSDLLTDLDHADKEVLLTVMSLLKSSVKSRLTR
ncbi:MAG: MarR family transcriptional regulator [Pseudomonadota bacterium]